MSLVIPFTGNYHLVILQKWQCHVSFHMVLLTFIAVKEAPVFLCYDQPILVMNR